MTPSALPFLPPLPRWLPALLLAAVVLPAAANQEPAGELPPLDPPVSCLGDQPCAKRSPESSPAGREKANEVLEQVYALPESEKAYLLAKLRGAKGFAIFPNVRKGGIMAAALYGKGILSYRDDQGAWSPPILLTMEGQSLGPQFGAQTSNTIFIFTTVCGIKDFLSGHHHVSTSGLGTSVEHVGDTAPSEPLGITVHTFERGMFLGQSHDRYSISIDEDANAALYGVALKPGCIVEGVRFGPKPLWIQRYFERLHLPPGQPHDSTELK